MPPYPHQDIEKKWQKKWEEDERYTTPDSKRGRENFYCLVEFPYPSGNLHIGHWYAFAVPDIFARYKRLKGFNVLYPIGFDSFGLPAENAAIKHGADPKKWTYDNIEVMTAQIKSMGASFDWSRKVVASDPAYYKWTQWLFLQMYEKGLAYRGRGLVNWDPVDQTVLANEQVLPDGTAERSGAKVEKRELEQWLVRITDYADRLLSDLDDLKWPEEIKTAQRNWIGKKVGINITYAVEGTDEKVVCFTTRPDTNFGATFIVLAPEHPFAARVADGTLKPKDGDHVSEVRSYIEQTKRKTEIERQAEGRTKTGAFTGFFAVNNLNNERLPIWISDFVLAGFGTGAVVGVPGHDRRDFAFAQQFRIPIRRVVVGPDSDASPIEREEQVQEEAGTMINSDFLDGLEIHQATVRIMDHLEEHGWGARVTTYRLRDWLISRQRYWGCPIPIVYDPEGKPHPIPEKHLPWMLPDDVNFKPTGTSPLGTSRELAERTEKIFGKGWRPELDTMDTFVDSSWYFLRYTDPQNEKAFADKKKLNAWMPVNRYSGGAEHTTMHLLYSRFFHKALFDLGLVAQKEPYEERFNRGIILGTDGQKMSKRWGYMVYPDEQVEQYGADAVRMYLAFIGPYHEVGSYPWQPTGLAGLRRFLDKVYVIASTGKAGAKQSSHSDLDRLLHKTIKKVGEDIEAFKFNTAIAQMMTFVNAAQGGISRDQFQTFLILLSSFAPHLAEELWTLIGNKGSVFDEEWPAFDPKLIHDAVVEVAVQVNGKLRGTVTLAPDANEPDAITAARAVVNVAKHLEGQQIIKTIYLAGRMVNFVIK